MTMCLSDVALGVAAQLRSQWRDIALRNLDRCRAVLALRGRIPWRVSGPKAPRSRYFLPFAAVSFLVSASNVACWISRRCLRRPAAPRPVPHVGSHRW